MTELIGSFSKLLDDIDKKHRYIEETDHKEQVETTKNFWTQKLVLQWFAKNGEMQL